MTEESPQLRRIRGLLDKANDPAVTEHEREAYTEAAMRLIAQHGVTEEMLAAQRPDTDRPGKRVISLTGVHSRSQMELATCIAEAFPTQTYYVRKGRMIDSVVIYGFEADLDKIEFLFTLLLIQMFNEVEKVKADPDDWPFWFGRSELAAETKRLRVGFMVGYAARIRTRLVAMFADAREEYDREHGGSGTELVLASKHDRVLALFKEENPEDIKPDRPRDYDSRGVRLGAAAADRADLGGTKLKTTGQRALTA